MTMMLMLMLMLTMTMTMTMLMMSPTLLLGVLHCANGGNGSNGAVADRAVHVAGEHPQLDALVLITPPWMCLRW